jgi:hypothetical protein
LQFERANARAYFHQQAIKWRFNGVSSNSLQLTLKERYGVFFLQSWTGPYVLLLLQRLKNAFHRP